MLLCNNDGISVEFGKLPLLVVQINPWLIDEVSVSCRSFGTIQILF